MRHGGRDTTSSAVRHTLQGALAITVPTVIPTHTGVSKSLTSAEQDIAYEVVMQAAEMLVVCIGGSLSIFVAKLLIQPLADYLKRIDRIP